MLENLLKSATDVLIGSIIKEMERKEQQKINTNQVLDICRRGRIDEFASKKKKKTKWF